MHVSSEHALRARANKSMRQSPRNLSIATEAVEEFGLSSFVVSPQKRPLTPNGKNDATRDLTLISAWLNRWPDALVAIPTGETSGVDALDIDRGGEISFLTLLASLGCPAAEDLSRVWSRTPGNGRHYFFKHRIGSTPRTRSSDIATNIDSRANGGSIIIPGNVLPDGRSYQWGGSARFNDMEHSPSELLFLMSFSARERAFIDATPDLKAQMSSGAPEGWSSIFDQWRDQEAAKIAPQDVDDDEGMRRQALHDLRAVAAEFASLTDGRRQKLFTLACKVGKYVAHGVLTDMEFRSALLEAARANGSLAKHGAPWVVTTIRNAINRASGDSLPPLARAFRSEKGSK